ncbi:MAG: hypothetical protein ACKO4Z_08065 [Planctomycetota bacterium]
MSRPQPPSTLVICAAAPRQPLNGRAADWPATARSLPVPVTWLVGVDAVAAADVGPEVELALDIPPAACGSRQRLRDLLARARDVAPTIAAVVLRGPTPVEHRGLLVEWGISVAIVDEFADESRGCRRPAPRGWACRNVVWGLWEVLVSPARPGGLAGWLGFSGPPRLRPGGLHVLRSNAGGTGSSSASYLTPRLQRWVGWAAQRRERGAADVVGLSALPTLICGAGRQPMAGSVLRAA